MHNKPSHWMIEKSKWNINSRWHWEPISLNYPKNVLGRWLFWQILRSLHYFKKINIGSSKLLGEKDYLCNLGLRNQSFMMVTATDRFKGSIIISINQESPLAERRALNRFRLIILNFRVEKRRSILYKNIQNIVCFFA